jgi:hypothetical protein
MFLQSSHKYFSSVGKPPKPDVSGSQNGFYPLLDRDEDYAQRDGSENSAVINQSSKNPGLKIISK